MKAAIFVLALTTAAMAQQTTAKGPPIAPGCPGMVQYKTSASVTVDITNLTKQVGTLKAQVVKETSTIVAAVNAGDVQYDATAIQQYWLTWNRQTRMLAQMQACHDSLVAQKK
jgi:hypothetical protein